MHLSRWLRWAVVGCLTLLPTAVFGQLPSPTYGWNLGNTLEPPCGEGCWAPAATQAMINAVAAAGFNTIRIPVAWDSHASQSAPYTINASWLNRVKQVVDWSLAADLTVVVNTHWDGGWLENNIGNTVNPTINAKMNSYWTQIANNFAGYDERLLFAAANEPNVDTAATSSTGKRTTALPPVSLLLRSCPSLLHSCSRPAVPSPSPSHEKVGAASFVKVQFFSVFPLSPLASRVRKESTVSEKLRVKSLESRARKS